MKTMILRCLSLTVATCALLAPAAVAQTGGDSLSSDNVEHVGNLREVGTGVGATIIGDYMYVTSTHALVIYDIKSNPAEPTMVGTFTLDVQFENEEVPTNGKILGISSDTFCVNPDPGGVAGSGTLATGGCLAIYDVQDPENVKLLANLGGAGDHTMACALDCAWMYGSGGHVVDVRDPANPILTDVDWPEVLSTQGYEQTASCHHAREIQPGILLGSCQPVVLFSIRPEDGASPISPVLLAIGANEDSDRFIHSSRWPRNGLDKFTLVGGEKNATASSGDPQCNDTVSAFMTWDSSGVIDGKGGFKKGSEMKMVDEVRPVNGTFTDGNSPYNILGCSVHWFSEHPSFNDGGLVALAEYEQGTRFVQITPEGKIVEQGWFLPTTGSTSAPHWNPHDPTIVYAIDYTRGVDVLKYTGDTYVPNSAGVVTPTPGATPGTNGTPPPTGAGACASAAGFSKAAAKGKGSGVRFDVGLRQKRPFTVDVFQQSAGRKVVKERLVARFKNKKKSFSWNGKDRKGRALTSGNYFVRFKMKTSSGATDTRRATLTRAGGKFKKAPDFYQRLDCGVFASLKLSSSAFGGTTREPLGISYKLSVPARSVMIAVKVGSKTIKAFTGKGEPNRTFRFRLPAKAVKAGKLAKVVVKADRGPLAAPTITLTAKRL